MLESSIRQRLLDRYRQMNVEGRLLSDSQLGAYYSIFRSRFGPDRLANLDGQALLETMHAHGSKDSLVYWIEFKNDDEFPSPHFGSISGGSAFKFGIFRRRETGTWVTADESNNPKDLTVEEAVATARKHRDQLIRGVDLLHQLPASGSDEDYQRLQVGLDQQAPDVSRLAWGHKYLSLLFPDKLDDYHVPDLQRFHLLKMLQTPPEGSGRYVCGGRFVAASHELGIRMNNLTEVLNSFNGRKHRYWRVGTSDGAIPRNHWPLMRDGGCVAIGWAKLGDLSALEANKESRERLQSLLAEKHPADPSVIGRARSQIMSFVTAITEGDYVLAADGGSVLGVGRVTGEYVYDGSSDFPHRRPVQWLSLDEWKLPDAEGLRTTVHEVRKVANILETEGKTQSDAARSGQGEREPIVRYDPEPRSERPRPPQLPGVAGHVQAVLDRKSQCILYGPPGTGKTFWAEKTALALASYWAFGEPFESLGNGEKGVVTGTDQEDGLVRVCCFHPAYGYEDFIEGYRPEEVSGHMTFRLRDGVFKRLSRDAERQPDRKFVLLVDEINRGDIPRIFGELLTVLETDKRGNAITLPVSGEKFRVPPNILLIGTMNTADRSISLLDAALRRRFGFVELMPDSSTLRDHSMLGVPLGPWLDALNRRVCQHVGRDARNLQVGHSYLLHGGRPVKNMTAFKRALRDDILPLLEEYCYEDFSALQSILGNGLLDLENGRIRQELFEDGQESVLIQALMEPCPEILTSAEALASGEPGDEPPAEEEIEEGDGQ